MARRGATQTPTSELRIIGGQWRGRKIAFSGYDGLRPTPGRVRETLFNWLMPDIHGARCIDLFAGSGALGLEALSRGAAHCTFVDNNPVARKHIDGALRMLAAETKAEVLTLRAEDFGQPGDATYDIAFIDPPFGLGLVSPTCEQLLDRALITPGGAVYIETSAKEPAPDVPAQWSLVRDKRAGDVAFRLYRVADA